MCSHIYYSTDQFETRTTLFEMKKMPANNMQYVEASPVISLDEDQELLVRVYPWYNGAATGKTICLSDVTISGIAMDASSDGIGHHTSETFAPIHYYAIDGRQHAQPQRGLNIVRQSDGSIRKLLITQ